MDWAWLSPSFHQEIADWRALAVQTASRLTHLFKIVRRKPTHMGFYNALGLGAEGMWLDPSRSSLNLVWCHPWPPDIIAELVSPINPKGTIKNSDLKLAALVLHEATLLLAVPTARMAAPRFSLDNTPTVSWSTREASAIKPVVTDSLFICALHSRQFFLNLLDFISQVKKMAWSMMPLASSIYLKPHFSPTCLSHTHSRSVHGTPPPVAGTAFPCIISIYCFFL